MKMTILLLKILSVLLFWGAAAYKIYIFENWMADFEMWGFPMWFLPIVIFLEVLVGLGFLFKKTSNFAGILGCGILVVALGTHIYYHEYQSIIVPLAYASVVLTFLILQKIQLQKTNSWR